MEQVVDLAYVQAEGEWNQLWQLELPPRILNFVWRLAREVVPTRAVLQRRGMQVPFECGVCKRKPEEAWHLFTNCRFADQCWQRARLSDVVEQSTKNMEFCAEWVFNVIRTIPEPKRSYIFGIAWSIWREWNMRVWE
ncbi:hypothetical protein LINPERHAP1_LOCUS30011 [Linum perenne]